MAVPTALLKRLDAIEINSNNRETPWDLKCIYETYNSRNAEREILHKLSVIRGESEKSTLEPYKLETEDRPNLSREARKFLSLNGVEQQAIAHQYFVDTHPPLTDEDRENFCKEILNKLNRMREHVDRES